MQASVKEREAKNFIFAGLALAPPAEFLFVFKSKCFPCRALCGCGKTVYGLGRGEHCSPAIGIATIEIHTLVGAGAAEGAVDAANILKPSLSRGEIQLIGATTINEYRKHIEKDAALERRFQPVMVDEPSQDEAVEILFGLRDKYEAHHKIKITDDRFIF